MRTLFLSHRGESDDAPENTLAAYQLAMERDSDGIELDLRLTRDRQVICCHDATLQRVSGVPLAVAEHPLAELRRHHHIPRFAEALDVLEADKHMQIEMKGSSEVLPFARDILAKYPHRERFAISSFEAATIRDAADFFPDRPRLLLCNLVKIFGRFPTAAEVVKHLAPLKCGVSFKADAAATPEFVRELRDAGLRVVCWGVFDDELGIKMAEIGVDALTSNHAVALRGKYLETHRG